MFLRLVREANLTNLLKDNEQDLTIFIPKNDVFREVSEWYNELVTNKRELTYLVKSHIIPGNQITITNVFLYDNLTFYYSQF